MSRTYRAYRDDQEFDVNFAGCSILSLITEKLAMPTSEVRIVRSDPPFECEPETAAIMADRLAIISDREYSELYNEVTTCKLFSGTQDDFKAWVEGWRVFLSQCQGYTVE